MFDIRAFLTTSLEKCANSKARRYLLDEKLDNDRKVKDKVISTILKLHDCSDDSSIIKIKTNATIGEFIEYSFNEYVLPNTLIKNFVEQTKVYLNVPSLEISKPFMTSSTSFLEKGREDEVMSPKELERFFEEFYSLIGKQVTLQNISKDVTITLSDLAAFYSIEKVRTKTEPEIVSEDEMLMPTDDYEYVILKHLLNNGGVKVPEFICILEDFTTEVPLYKYSRKISDYSLTDVALGLF